MMIIGKEGFVRKKPGGLSPRTKLPQIVGESRVIEEGGYQQGNSPISNQPSYDDGGYDNNFDDGLLSDAGRRRVRDSDADDPRELTLDSRTDGRAWEDGDAKEEKDPIVQGFREMLVLAQIARKKAGTKDFEAEMDALEKKLKRAQTHTSGVYLMVQHQLKTERKKNEALQQSLKGAKNTMNQTVTQALDDVTLLTQKLKSVEEAFARTRVDKEHIEKGFRSEMAAVMAKNSSLQKNLLSCKLELEELSHRMKGSDEKIRQVTFEMVEAQKTAETLQSQMSVIEDDMTHLKHREAKALQDLQQAQEELQLERASNRQQMENFSAQKGMANAELVRLQVQRDSAVKDSRKLDEYKDMNIELKKALAQAQVLLDDAEAVRSNGVKTMLESHREDLEQLKRRNDNEIEALQSHIGQLTNELKNAAEKGSYDREQARMLLETLSAQSNEAKKSLSASNELLTLEARQLKEQVVELQAQLSEKVKETTDLSMARSSLQNTHEQEVADLNRRVLAVLANNSLGARCAFDCKQVLTAADSQVAALEAALTNLQVLVEDGVLDRDGEEHGSDARATFSRDGISRRKSQGSARTAAGAGGEDEDEGMRELRERLRKVEEAVAQERELRAQAEERRGEMERKLFKVKNQRDATSKLAKSFMLQLSRAKVERLAAISLAASPSDISELVMQGKVPGEALKSQMEMIRGMIEAANTEHDDLSAAAVTLLSEQGLSVSNWVTKYSQEVTSTRMTSPEEPEALKKRVNTVNFIDDLPHARQRTIADIAPGSSPTPHPPSIPRPPSSRSVSVLPAPVGDVAAAGVGESEGGRRRAMLAVSGRVVLATKMLEADGKAFRAWAAPPAELQERWDEMTSNFTSKFADAAASAGTEVGGSSSNSSTEILREGGGEGVEAASKGLEEASKQLDGAFFGAPQDLSTRNMLNGLAFEALDADGDGRITQDEYNAAFALLDTDKNGFISRAEFGVASAAPFSLLDADADGQLSREEYEAGFALFDADNDGFISREEFSALKVLGWHPALLFEVLDVNGDDRIDRQEYNAGFAMLDANQDGFISREEFCAASAAAFDSLDRDADGLLSVLEYQAGFDLFDTDGDGFVTRQEFQA